MRPTWRDWLRWHEPEIAMFVIFSPVIVYFVWGLL